MSALPNYLEGPTYVPLRKHGEDTWFDETRASSSLQNAVEDIDKLEAVILIENGRVIDQSVEAAEMWWALNKHECDTVFDVPNFIHDHIHNQVYDEIAASRYEARCSREHEMGRVW